MPLSQQDKLGDFNCEVTNMVYDKVSMPLSQQDKLGE